MSRPKLFKNLTKQEKLVLWLKSLGYNEVDSRTGKYITMYNGKIYRFIGKNGAFRKYGTNTATKSISCEPNTELFELFCIGMESK